MKLWRMTPHTDTLTHIFKLETNKRYQVKGIRISWAKLERHTKKQKKKNKICKRKRNLKTALVDQQIKKKNSKQKTNSFVNVNLLYNMMLLLPNDPDYTMSM